MDGYPGHVNPGGCGRAKEFAQWNSTNDYEEGFMDNIGNVNNIAFLIGRVIAGCFFLMNGFNHFAQLNMMAGYAKSKGIPAPAFAVGGSGVVLSLGGLSLLLGYHPTIGVALLVIFLLGVTFSIHNFWTVQDQQAKIGEMTNFLKNMALLGLLLMTLAIPRPWPMSLGR
jgi:putative oxidoreductase